MPSWLQTDGSTKVTLDKMADSAALVSTPKVVSSASATVTCNALTVAIHWTRATDGYVVTLTQQ